jgi:hypothetical protein
VAPHPASSTSLAARPQASRSRSCLPAATVWYFFKFLLVSVAVVSLCILQYYQVEMTQEKSSQMQTAAVG